MQRRETNCPPLGVLADIDWSDKPLAVVGTGPSLAGFDWKRLDIPGVRCLAIKEAVWQMPFADAVFALHRQWLTIKERELTELQMEKIFAVEPEFEPAPVIPGATYIFRNRYPGLSVKMTEISSGGNSGFGGFNVATLRRAKKIVLFGFDYTAGVDGKHHADPKAYHWYNPANANLWESWGHSFNDAMPQLRDWGVEVVNASPNSTVRAFPKCTVDEGIDQLKKWAA